MRATITTTFLLLMLAMQIYADLICSENFPSPKVNAIKSTPKVNAIMLVFDAWVWNSLLVDVHDFGKGRREERGREDCWLVQNDT
jgi:hypothetical protein